MDKRKDFNEQRLIEDIIVDSVIKSQNNNMQKLFLSVDNVGEIANFIKKLVEDKFEEEVNLIQRSIEAKKFLKPYYPFLELIKEDFEGEEDKVEVAIEEAEVYYFQRGLLKDYLLGEETNRYEEMMVYIDNELEYEKEELHRSLLNLITLKSPSNVNIYLIKNIQNIKPSTLRFIEYISKSSVESNYFFIFLFSQEYNFFSEKSRESWIDFLEGISNKDYYFSISSYESYLKGSNFVEKKVDLDQYKLEELIDLSWDSFNLLAIEESKDYLEIVYSFILDKGVIIDEEYYLELLILLGDIHNMLGFDNCALDYYNLYLDFAIEKNHKRDIVDAYRKLATVNFKSYQLESSERYIVKALKLAREINDEILILKCNILLHGVLISIEDNEEGDLNARYYKVFYELEELFSKYKFYNIYSGICGSMAGDNRVPLDKRLDYCNKGIEMAKKRKNKNRLASLYHNKGMIFSIMGDNESSFDFYKRSEKLKLDIGNSLEIIRIYNGMGYAYFYVEDYEEAIKYYNKALPFLKRTKNFREIASNFYNVAITYFFALEYSMAIEYFEKTVTLLDVLNSDNIPFHSIYDIYSLLASSYFKVNKLIKAKEYINKINLKINLYKPTFNQEERSYYNIAYALMENKDGSPSSAIKIFEDLIGEADINAFHKYLVPKIYYEYALLLKEVKEADRSKSILRKGIEICNEMGYDFHKHLMKNELEGFDSQIFKERDRLNFEVVNFDIGSIIEYTKQEMIMSRLYKRIDEINFLNKLQKVLLESQSGIEETIKEVCSLIDIIFTVDFIGFYLKKANRLESIYISEDELRLEAEDIMDVFLLDRGEVFISSAEDDIRVEGLIKEFDSIIKIPLIKKGSFIGHIIIANKKDRIALDQDFLRILSIASKQILVAISNKELEKKVKVKNRELERVNSSVKNLLDNVSQGFLSFGSNLLIDKEYSLECKNIFGFDIANKRFIDIMNLSQYERDLVYKILVELLALDKENIEKKELYIGLLPDLLEVNGMQIEVKYKLVSQKNRNKIMIILTDISEKIELESKMKEERSNLKMIVTAVSNRNEFKKRIDDYREYGYKDIISKGVNSKDILYDIFRTIHTFKGDFSQWYMFNTVRALQKIESEISSLIEISEEGFNDEEIADALNKIKLEGLLDDDLEIIASSLGSGFFEVEETITVNKESVIDIEKQILSTFEPHEYNIILPKIRSWRYKSLKEILGNYPESVMALAERLGKKVREFNIIGDHILVEEEIYYGFVKSLVHIFRNILDHGIEEPEERISKGKEEKGQILCKVKEVGFDIVILISDDGRGINPNLIKERALERGFYNKEGVHSLTEEELLNLIFYDQFSTKKVADNISGRGMGLSAVKGEVEKLGGKIELSNKVDEGCGFKIIIPHKEKLMNIENSIELIMDIFLDKLSDLFQTVMNITIFEDQRIKNRDIRPHLRELKVVLDIDSDHLYNVILTVDYDLAKNLLHAFIIGEISESEEEELMQEALEEILNIVVGNSSQYLEDNKSSILFLPPDKLNVGELDFDQRWSSNLTLLLKTIYGRLTVSIVLKNI